MPQLEQSIGPKGVSYHQSIKHSQSRISKALLKLLNFTTKLLSEPERKEN